MCQFFSPIVTRKMEILHCVDIDDSHETVIEKFKLKDDKLEDRDFVRLEIEPKDYKQLTKTFKISDWNYGEDEESTLPSWYLKNQEKIKSLAFDELKKIYRKMFVFGKEKRIINNGRIFAYDSSTVEAYSSSVVKAYDSSTVKAYDSSIIKAYSSSVVEAYDSSVVEAYSSSVVEAYDSSTTIVFSCKRVKVESLAVIVDRRKFAKVETYTNKEIKE